MMSMPETAQVRHSNRDTKCRNELLMTIGLANYAFHLTAGSGSLARPQVNASVSRWRRTNENDIPHVPSGAAAFPGY